MLFHDDFEDGKIGAAWDEVNRRKGRGATDATEPVEAETDKAITVHPGWSRKTANSS